MNQTYSFIESSRLLLIALTLDHHLLYPQPKELANTLGIKSIEIELEPDFQDAYDDAVENFWKPNLIKFPDQYQWYTNWLIVLKDVNIAIGGIGMAGIPNEKGEAEIGYSIGLGYRGQGYATEAALCLEKWVFAQPEVSALIAHTLSDKNASQQVLIKAGFECKGTEITEDGEVFLWKKLR